MARTLVTWNVHGSSGLDADAVVAQLDATGADLAVLQEIERRQAAAVAAVWGAPVPAWCHKHRAHPLRPAEGMAVIDRERRVATTCRAITAPRRWWSWRRRIVQVATIEVDLLAVQLVHAHLSPHPGGAATRRREAGTIVGMADAGAADGRWIVAGDLNERPGGDALEVLRAAGLHDAWDEAGDRAGAGSTNWSSGSSPAPDQRLDYVLLGTALVAERAAVPEVDDARGTAAAWRAVSDHLPLAVTLRRADDRAGPLAR